MPQLRGKFYVTEQIGPKQSLTPEGFLLCEEVPLARTGMMIYGPDETPIEAGPEGIVKIFRDEEQVFRAETIASAQGKPVTNDHPDDDVVPETWKELSEGILMNVRRGAGNMDDLLVGDILVTTPDGIQAVQGGKREVSLGYEADYHQTGPGTGYQANILINHIALVEQGRCGPRCAIGDRKPGTTPLKGDQMSSKKTNRILDALMAAFKAKDADEVEELAKQVGDDMTGEEGEGVSGDTHVHIHAGSDEGVTSGEGGFTKDEDFAAHVDKNEKEHAELRARIEALEAAIAGNGATGGTGDEGEVEGEVEGDVPPVESLDEIPEEFKEEAKKSKDSAYFQDSYQETVSLAEILAPGIRVPTFDAAAKPGLTFKKICTLRRQALDTAYAQPATRGLLDDILGGKPLDTKRMTCDAVRTLFRSAAAMKRTANNNGGGHRVADQNQGPTVMTLAMINKRNAERFGNS